MRLITGIAIAGLFTGGAAQPQYEVVDLTKLFGTDFTAVDINNQGTVVGHMRLNSAQDQACIVQNGKLTMLPMYQGIHPWYAIGIGDDGAVLGAGSLGMGQLRSFVYSGGKVTDIGVPGSPESPGAFGINNLGQVTGGMNGTPFIWDNGTITSLPGPPFSSARAINDSQQLAGLRAVGVEYLATSWDGTKWTDIHPNWARRSEAVSLNQAGEAVGSAWAITGGQHGVLWRDGKSIQLGNFGGGQSRAYDINDLSQVVGWANSAGQPDEAFFWENGSIYRLEDLILGGSGFQILGRGTAINNPGQILSIGFGGGSGHYLVLNLVPEPGTMLGLAGCILLLTISRRRTGRRG